MISQRDIALLSNRLHREKKGRRIPESLLERDYCLAWLLASLANHSLGERLAFKGGTALKRCYFVDYRFSEDLDFTMLQQKPFPEIQANLEEIFGIVHDQSAIQFGFDHLDEEPHANSYTFYLSYQGPLPARNTVKVNITISERVVFPIEYHLLLRSYEEFSDLPNDRRIGVYSLQEILTEKIVALADRGRNEPRDLFDAWYLMQEGLQLAGLVPQIEAKLAFRNRPLAGIEQRITQKETRLRRLWTHRLSQQIAQLPEFDRVFREFRRQLRQARFPE